MPRNGIARLAVFFSLMALSAWAISACGPQPISLEEANPPPATGLTDVAAETPADTPTLPTPIPADTPITVPPSLSTDAPSSIPSSIPSSENVSSTTPATDPPGVGLNFVIAKLNARGEISELKDDDELVSCADEDAADPYVSCDNVYGLYFEPAQDAYIYALQQDETGSIDVLFPNEVFSEGQGNPVAAGTQLWVPNNFAEWFYLAVNRGPDPIEETIFVAVAAERIDVLERYMACVIDTCDERNAVQSQVLEILPTLGLGGSTRRVGTIQDPEGNMTDLASLILDSAGEDQLVYQVKFKNLPPD